MSDIWLFRNSQKSNPRPPQVKVGPKRYRKMTAAIVFDVVESSPALRSIMNKPWRARNRNDLVIEVWEKLDCESVGKNELLEIQRAIADRFGEGAVESPAAIARTLADEGAILRHPEVLNFDSEWRERNLVTLISPDDLNFSGLSEAVESIKKLDAIRIEHEGAGRLHEITMLRELALEFKQEAQNLAKSNVVEPEKRRESSEIAQWLTVWLQEPEMFADWLGLRQRSPGFKRRFGNYN